MFKSTLLRGLLITSFIVAAPLATPEAEGAVIFKAIGAKLKGAAKKVKTALTPAKPPPKPVPKPMPSPALAQQKLQFTGAKRAPGKVARVEPPLRSGFGKARQKKASAKGLPFGRLRV